MVLFIFQNIQNARLLHLKQVASKLSVFFICLHLPDKDLTVMGESGYIICVIF